MAQEVDAMDDRLYKIYMYNNDSRHLPPIMVFGTDNAVLLSAQYARIAPKVLVTGVLDDTFILFEKGTQITPSLEVLDIKKEIPLDSYPDDFDEPALIGNHINDYSHRLKGYKEGEVTQYDLALYEATLQATSIYFGVEDKLKDLGYTPSYADQDIKAPGPDGLTVNPITPNEPGF